MWLTPASLELKLGRKILVTLEKITLKKKKYFCLEKYLQISYLGQGQ